MAFLPHIPLILSPDVIPSTHSADFPLDSIIAAHSADFPTADIPAAHSAYFLPELGFRQQSPQFETELEF